jgi:transposase
MAAHYDTAVVPARPRKPRDKAKVEVAVQVATRWIIAKLRNRREVVDGTTGEVRVCQVFVAALGASNYT